MIGNLILIVEFIRRALRIWQQVPLEFIGMRKLSAAMTNAVYTIFHSHYLAETVNEPKKLLVRIYGVGSEGILNRSDELDFFVKMSMAGAGPRLLATFQNGRIEEYIESVTLTPRMMRSEEVSVEIARSLAKFHAIQVERDHEIVLWKRLENWRREAKKSMKLLMKREEVKDKLERIKSFGIFDEEEFTEETGKWKKLLVRLRQHDSPVVLCHNDLQHGNILLTDKNEIIFIDYEYGGINYAAFDIANHFCEWASDFTESNPTPHLMNFNELYPNLEERERFLCAYLNETDPTVIGNWIKVVEDFKEISHLLWTYWAIIQATSSKIDFDYLSYSFSRLEAIRI